MAARKLLHLFLVSALGHLIPAETRAKSLGHPNGKIILADCGKIRNTNRTGAVDFDLEMLETLGTESPPTTTSWTDGIQKFSVMPLRRGVSAVEARGKTVEALALNDYTYEIEIEDYSRFPVIRAVKLYGKILKTLDKGPLGIVYPLDDFTESGRIQIERRMIRQLRRLIVK